MLRVLRMVRTPGERLETEGGHHDRDNASDTTRHLAFNTREHEDVCGVVHMLVAFPTMEMLNMTRFIAKPRTPNLQQFHLVLVEIGANVQDWLVHVSRPLPKTLW